MRWNDYLAIAGYALVAAGAFLVGSATRLIATGFDAVAGRMTKR